MNIARVFVAAVAAAFVCSFTDWLFMGVLWHDKYLAYPEVWRRQAGDKAGESKAVLWACLLNVLTCAVFAVVAARFRLNAAKDFKLAAALWIALPVPMLLGNALFIKIHPKITLAHCLGWLAKLVVCAAAAAALLP
jgi:hypothetical protein